MSSQPFPPTGGPSAAIATPASAAAPPSGRRRPALIAVGALLATIGVVAGLVMIVAAGSNYDDGVQNLARAPIGCTTELEFGDAGTFTIYVETVGTVGELRGDCPNADKTYNYGAGDLPDVDLVLVNDDGDEIDLDRDSSKEYDAAGAVGRSVASVDIEIAGEYVLTVTSDDDDFAIAVGKSPKDVAASTGTTGMLIVMVGLVLGVALVLLGLRRTAKPAGATVVPVGPGFGAPQQYPPVPPIGVASAVPSVQPMPPTQPMPPSHGASPPPPPPLATPPPPAGPSAGGPQWPAPPTS